MNKLINPWYFLFSVFLLLSATLKTHAQDAKFKAIFVYNFAKYINWPAKGGGFVITILGNGDIVSEIEGIASKKMIGNSPIETKRVNSPDEIPNCQIVFVTAGKTSMLPQLTQMAKEKNILLITEKPDACASGSGINFVIKDGKLTFEMSKPNIESCGLEISTDLLKLGTVLKN
jgi:hypothetical protein